MTRAGVIGPLEKHSESAPAECAHLSPATYSLLLKLAEILSLSPYRLFCKLVIQPTIGMSVFILTVCLFGEGMCEHRREPKPIAPVAYGSSLPAVLDKHRLAAQVANAKPAGRGGAEPKAL